MTQSLIYSVLSVYLMMVPGYIMGKKGWLSDVFLANLTTLIVKFIYPFLAFTSVLKDFSLEILMHNWQLPLASMVVTLCGYLVVRLFLLFYSIKDQKQKSSFTYLGTFSNYIFMPLAIIAQVFPQPYIAAVVLASLGTEFLVWSLGVIIMQPQHKFFSKETFQHLFSPPLIALYLAVLGIVVLDMAKMSLEDLFEQIPPAKYVFNSLSTLGQATVPMTIIMAGARIAQTNTALIRIKEIWIVSGLRLVVVPALAILAVKLLFPHNEFAIVMMVAALTPSAFNSLVLGELFKADMQLISGAILVMYILSLFTITAWMLILV